MKTLNAVFIQPSYECALNCRGCYIKESKRDSEMSSETLLSLIRWLWVTPKLWIRQITLAVDDLPDEEGPRDKMVAALSSVLRLRKLYGNGRTELHITCNSIFTLQKYIDFGLSLEYIVQNIDLLSVSHLTIDDRPALQYIRQFTKVNYNYMPTRSMSGYEEMLKHVDQSYFILHKAGLGRKNNPEQVGIFKDGLLRLRLFKERHKVIVDSCVQDSNRYKSNGTGCSANISKLHIWPDGHISGCPYNKEGGTPSKSITEFCNNLAKTFMQYEFTSCTIPRDYTNKRGLAVI